MQIPKSWSLQNEWINLAQICRAVFEKWGRIQLPVASEQSHSPIISHLGPHHCFDVVYFDCMIYCDSFNIRTLVISRVRFESRLLGSGFQLVTTWANALIIIFLVLSSRYVFLVFCFFIVRYYLNAKDGKWSFFHVYHSVLLVMGPVQ